MFIKSSIVLVGVLYSTLVLGQEEYSSTIKFLNLSEGVTLSNRGREKITIGFPNDSTPTIELDKQIFKIYSPKAFGISADIVVTSDGEEWSIFKKEYGYESIEGNKYQFKRCKDGWNWCVENGRKKVLKGGYRVVEEKLVLKIELDANLKNKEIVGLMLCRLILEASLSYNHDHGIKEKSPMLFWLFLMASHFN